MSITASAEARVVFVNRFFFPDHSATSQILSELAFALADAGRPVVIVTSRQIYDDPNKKLPALESIRRVEIHRLATTRFGRIHLLGRAVDYVTFYLSCMLTLLRLLRRSDILVLKTDPPLMSVVLTPLARLRGARVMNWLQDVYPEVLEADGLTKNRLAGIGVRLLKRLRDRSLRRAEMNVVLGERMAMLIAATGVPEERVTTSSNWALQEITQCDEEHADFHRRKSGLGDRFIVGYSGNLGRVHDSDTMANAMRRTSGNDEHITWLFTGGGAKFARLKELAAREQISSVTFLPYQDASKLSETLALAHVHIVTLRPQFEGLIVPSKTYGILAAARPIIFIGAQNGEVADILRRFSCGVTVQEGDADGLVEAIRMFQENPQIRREMGTNARAAFDRNFTLQQAVLRWHTIVTQTSTRRPGSRGR